MEKQNLYLKRAIVPSLVSVALLGSFAMMTKRSSGTTLFLSVLGLPIGYVIGNAGKW